MLKNKILITGGAGFIGHHIIRKLLLSTNCSIISLDRLDYSGSYNRINQIISENKNWQKRLKIVWHDLKAEINPMIKKQIGNPDIILHVAAASHVDRSIKDPMSFVLDNVVGTTNILEFAKNNKKIKKFLYFSTDEVFGPAPKKTQFKEDDRYKSGNPYAASKAGGEEMCMAYANTYKLPVIITHTMNVFGERQHPEKFIPKIIKSLINKKSITIHSNKNRTLPGSRFYIHAQDVADGLMFILNLKNYKHKGDFGNAKCPKFNLVGPEEIDNLTLAEIIAKSQNKKLVYELIDNHTSRPGHDLRYSLSPNLLKSLGWEPKIKLSQRIEEVVNWSLENKHWLSEK